MKALVVSAALLVAVQVGAVAQDRKPGGLLDELVGNQSKPATQNAGAGASQPKPPPREAVQAGDIQHAWDSSCGRAPQGAPGIHYWHFSAGRTECFTFRQVGWTVFYFPEWESIERVVLGDPASFELYSENGQVVKPFPNVVMIRTKDGIVGVDSTLHFFGAAQGGMRNVYTAMARSVGVDNDKTTDVTVFVDAQKPGAPQGGIVDFSVPQQSPAASPAAANAPQVPPLQKASALTSTVMGVKAPDYLRDVPFDLSKMKFGEYEVRAKDDESLTIAPERVFSDDRFTYVDFGEGGRADRILRPVVFRVVDGIDNPVNTRTTGPEGNILLIEGVGYNFTLRNGDRTVCILYTGHALLAKADGGDAGK